VIAGTHGGRTLRAPAGRETRPTSDRVREALFAMLDAADAVAEARVLDLFAGSGALAIEALSRGAAQATFVDASSASIETIRANLEALQLHADVHRRPAEAFLATARGSGAQYDLVFLDPPYRRADVLGPEVRAALVAVLAPGARVVAESDRRAPIDLDLPVLTERRYGDTLIRIHGSR
jgi:16S rRNA (guanine966-N2)-methyltransferase